MKKFILFFSFLLFTFAATQLTSCKKDILLSKDYLTFSADTVLFDTVFTTVGSTTKRLLIYNSDSKPVKISAVHLEGGKNSPYRINLDGVPGTSFKNITIPAKDSLYLFVEVTLGEGGSNTPFIVVDSIRFNTNGKEQYVQLAAWGQDAYFYNNDIVSGDWYNDKPHVIYNIALVDSLSSLTIHAGAKVHLHKNAILYVNSGELHIQGTVTDKVIFQGDRLEPFYNDIKGQYYGIYLNEALSSTIDNAVIKNGTAGIHVYSKHPNNTDYTLTITNTELYNHASYGLFNYSGGSIRGENLNIHNNGVYAYFLLEGGSHNFTHSQFLSYGAEGNHPAVAIKNYFTRNDGYTYIGNIDEGTITNSIIYGNGDYQIGYDTLTNNGAVSIHYSYDSNLIRFKDGIDDAHFVNNLWNQGPKFENIGDKLFIIKENSPCVNAGNPSFWVEQDIEGTWRDPSQPDIGAYEYN